VPTTDSARNLVSDLVATLAQELLDQLDELATEVTETIHTELPILPGDEEFRGGTFESGVRIIDQILRGLRDGGDMSGIEPPSVSLDYAGEYVHRGVELQVLLAVVRIGYRVLAKRWSQRLRDCDAPAEAIAEAMASSLLDIFTYVDTISAGLAAAYGDERERWSRSLEATQMDLARAILAGQSVDRTSVEPRLNHRLDGEQRGFLVWADGEHAPGLRVELHAAAQELTRHVGAARSLLLPLGAKTLAGWIGTLADDRPWRELGVTSALGVGSHDIRTALGGVGSGTDGFRETHEQAELARYVARLSAAPPGSVTRYEDVAVIALATGDLAKASSFVRYTLGPLAAEDPSTRRVADTLRVYLEEGRNRARTARRLGVHPNTVAYRLGRARELLDREPSERSSALELALTIAPLVTRDAPDGA
jgi:PucR C-terminal helix-turn-helix domain